MDNVAVLRALYDAFNAQDFERAFANVAEDVEWVNVALESVRNRQQLIEGYPAFFAAFPDLHVAIVNIFGSGPFVTIEWHARGTNTGPFMDREPTGNAFERRGCSVAELRDGKVVRYRDYFDRATMLRQLGLLEAI